MFTRRESTPKLGDIFMRFARDLNLSTKYIVNLKPALEVIAKWQKKSKKFASIMSSLEVSTRV